MILREGELLLGAVPAKAVLVALDRRGKVLDSEGFARRLARWRDDSVSDVAFLIGGADGHGEPLLKKAALVLSFGAMTWPHLLARAMLAEQIYRAQQLLAGHPYHRRDEKWRRFCLCSDEKPGLHWHPCASLPGGSWPPSPPLP